MEKQRSKSNIQILNVGCCRHEGDWNWQSVRSPFARLYYVTEGTAQVRMMSTLYMLQPHKMYFIPAYVEHDCICTSHFVHYYIHIFEDWDNDMGLFDEYDFPVEINAESIDLTLMKRLVLLNPLLSVPQSNPDSYDNHNTLVSNMVKHNTSPLGDRIESHGIVYVLLSRFLQKATPKYDISDNRIKHTLVYMRRHVDEQLDIEQLADMACMSKDHFIRVFKREVGETPYSYFVKRKQEAIERVLATTTNSIKSVASAMGYDDYTYFIKSFKKNTGFTPQQYREKFLG